MRCSDSALFLALIQTGRWPGTWSLHSRWDGRNNAESTAGFEPRLSQDQNESLGVQDAVEVARALAETQHLQEGVSAHASWRSVTTPALTQALRAFEKKRSKRIFPLAARSWGMGVALQLPFPPVQPSLCVTALAIRTCCRLVWFKVSARFPMGVLHLPCYPGHAHPVLVCLLQIFCAFLRGLLCISLLGMLECICHALSTIELQ